MTLNNIYSVVCGVHSSMKVLLLSCPMKIVHLHSRNNNNEKPLLKGRPNTKP